MNECVALFKAKKRGGGAVLNSFFPPCISEEYWCEHQEGLFLCVGGGLHTKMRQQLFMSDETSRICRHLVKSLQFCGNADKFYCLPSEIQQKFSSYLCFLSPASTLMHVP